MGAIASLDVLGIGSAVELQTADGQRVVATGVAGQTGATSTSLRQANAAPVAVDTTATTIATVGPVTLTATQVVDVAAMCSISNVSEGGAAASDNTLQVYVDGTPLLAPQAQSWATGSLASAIAWVASGLSFAAGAHTFTLRATASAGAGNTSVSTDAGVLSLRIFGS